MLDPAAYQDWLQNSGSHEDLAAQGKALFRQYGCTGCHVNQAASGIAPPLQGLFGRQVALADGSHVLADEGYLRDSILLPQKQLVAGYAPIMPTYSNLLDEEAVQRLVAYLRSLADQTPQEVQ